MVQNNLMRLQVQVDPREEFSLKDQGQVRALHKASCDPATGRGLNQQGPCVLLKLLLTSRQKEAFIVLTCIGLVICMQLHLESSQAGSMLKAECVTGSEGLTLQSQCPSLL